MSILRRKRERDTRVFVESRIVVMDGDGEEYTWAEWPWRSRGK